jgi:hypothetical protein
MSGGSMNYLSSRIEMDATFKTHTALRKAFRKHLDKVIKALHDIEWVDSCDYSDGDEEDAIRACLSPGAPLESAIEDAKATIAVINEELERLAK